MPSSLDVVILINPQDAQDGGYPLQLWHENKPLASGRVRIDRGALLESANAFDVSGYGMQL
jgi:hypothetical protein